MKNNLQWFKHYSDAPDNEKFEALRATYGWAGEGQFWALNCYISKSEGCRLDLSKKFRRARIANKFGRTMEEFARFLDFLADPEECGLLQREGEVYSTEITQEDLDLVNKDRKGARTRKKKGGSPERGESSSEPEESSAEVPPNQTTEQSRAEQNRQEEQQKAENLPAASPFSADSLKKHLAGHRVCSLSFDHATAEQIVQALVEHHCADLDYVDFVVEKMAARARDSPIANKTGFFLNVVFKFDDWRDEWRRKRRSRIRCAECGATGGRHVESCPQITGQRQVAS